MIAIVDYGAGNLGSLENMLRSLEISAQVTSSPERIRQASGIILPGVGAFDACAKSLKKSGLIPTLEESVLERKTPLLGICVGMQLLAERSEEGFESGLGWIAGFVRRFSFSDEKLRIPHMGWNTLKVNSNTDLFAEVSEEDRFYFVHSFHFVPNDPSTIAATCHYGYDFTAAVRSRNIYGVQFHPEKSLRFGMRLIRNFSRVIQ